MATTAEIGEALADYRGRCNANPRLRKMLRKWSRVCEFRSLDSDTVFVVTIVAGEITDVQAGPSTGPVDVSISATSEDLADMFWGDLNPAQKYLTGEIKVVGSQEDVLRVDAMAAVIWVD
jgi:putative sterol carrier protein